jgi:hypothetical protein
VLKPVTLMKLTCRASRHPDPLHVLYTDPGKIGLVARTERRRDEVHKESQLGYDHRLLRGHSRSQPSFKPS